MAEKNKILLAEDDNFISRAYKDGLEGAGFEVETAITGEEVLEKLKGSDYDLLLLDIIMPEKDGFEVMEEINMEEMDSPPIVVISNLGQKTDMEKAQDLGAVDYLVKSDHSMKEVIEKVKYQMAK